MKKFFFMLCFAMSIFASNAFAELKEVRGIQTRSVAYAENEEVTYYGYELKNENNYPVWVEMKLKTSGFRVLTGYNGYEKYTTIPEGVIDTKNVTLKAGETYIWKCGAHMIFETCVPYSGFHLQNYREKFYIEYKAYKAE